MKEHFIYTLMHHVYNFYIFGKQQNVEEQIAG